MHSINKSLKEDFLKTKTCNKLFYYSTKKHLRAIQVWFLETPKSESWQASSTSAISTHYSDSKTLLKSNK